MRKNLQTEVAESLGIEEQLVCAVIAKTISLMGWEEIKAFHAEKSKGQSVFEDAGGYLLRCIAVLFGKKTNYEVLNYQDAMRAMIDARGQTHE